MYRHFILCVLLVTLGVQSAECQEPLVLASAQFDGHTYKLYQVPGGIRWVDAAALAESLGGNLATISSPAENEVLATMLDSAIASGTRCGPSAPGEPYINTWFGLSQDGTGAWTWVTGEPLTYTNWGPGEPNDSGGEDFGMMFCPETGKRGQWNDAMSLTPEVPASNQFFAEFEAVPNYSCIGFAPPLAQGPVTVRGNRALPFKAVLTDASGAPVTSSTIANPPVIQVLYVSSSGGSPVDITAEAVPAALSTSGNQFSFVDGVWQYNLRVAAYSAPGTYTVSLRSGADLEYTVQPTCQASFIVK